MATALRVYYWAFRPLLLVSYVAIGLFEARGPGRFIDALMVLALWCFPFWVRRRFFPALRKHDPARAEIFERALQLIDAERKQSLLPWVRVGP